MKWLSILILNILILTSLCAQFKGRLVTGFDFYQYYRNPKDNSVDLGGSSGGILVPSIGTEFILGKRNFSVGVEAQVSLGLLNFDTKYKGLGAVSFPLMMKINMASLSGFSSRLLGYSLGAGIQFQRTELFGLISKYDLYQRKFFPTYIVQFEIGGGIGGLNASVFVRLGKSFVNNQSFSLNSGIAIKLNFKNSDQSNNYKKIKQMS
ncbi:MAG: hypothetical protein IT267_12370 [Saprospiraceae bacterium]|nr:hypothetical protein [Saprospiraceae bacterium]